MARTALVTGCSTGIGRALALALPAAGFTAITLLDLDGYGVRATAEEVQRQHTGCATSWGKVDVTDGDALAAAFQEHIQRHQRLDLVVLNAGIGEQGTLFREPANSRRWVRTLDVDLTAVIDGVKQAVLTMEQTKSKGDIICIASAGGVFPMPQAPVYSASKAGVVQFVRSVGGSLARRGIRLLAVGPEFVDTPLVRQVMEREPETAKKLLGSLDIKLLPPQAVSDLLIRLIKEPTDKGGSVVLLRQDGRVERPFQRAPTKQLEAAKGAGSTSAGRPSRLAWATSLPHSAWRKWQVQQLSSDFRAAAKLVPAGLPSNVLAAPPAGQLLVRRVFVGINASDINYTSGRYHGSPKVAAAKLPFDCGFESCGVVAAVGPGVTGFAPGDCVASLTYDGFADLALLPASQALPVPVPRAEVVALLTSGLTASIALEQCGSLKPGETVLVTAAAGGTGQFAVQLARLAGCHVIATAGGPDKVELCKRLGADRVVDYKSEQLKDVLRKEYPKGVDVVYESVGGTFFSDAVDSLAQGGRLIIIGLMSSYKDGWPASQNPGLPEKLLWKSASLHGFFLLRFAKLWRSHLARLMELWSSGQLQVVLDTQRFVGLEAVPAAVDRLQSGKSMGKVLVQVATSLPAGSAEATSTLSKL